MWYDIELYFVQQECVNKLEFDQIRLAKTRLNAYKGLASGSYISFYCKDPVISAFDLAKEIRDVAKVEKYYKVGFLLLTQSDCSIISVASLYDKNFLLN